MGEYRRGEMRGAKRRLEEKENRRDGEGIEKRSLTTRKEGGMEEYGREEKKRRGDEAIGEKKERSLASRREGEERREENGGQINIKDTKKNIKNRQ